MSPNIQPTAPFLALAVVRKCASALVAKETSICIVPRPNVWVTISAQHNGYVRFARLGSRIDDPTSGKSHLSYSVLYVLYKAGKTL
jgi:hypothetical protein